MFEMKENHKNLTLTYENHSVFGHMPGVIIIIKIG